MGLDLVSCKMRRVITTSLSIAPNALSSSETGARKETSTRGGHDPQEGGDTRAFKSNSCWPVVLAKYDAWESNLQAFTVLDIFIGLFVQ